MKILTFLLEAMIKTCKDLYLVVMLPGFYPTGKAPGNPRFSNIAKQEKRKENICRKIEWFCLIWKTYGSIEQKKWLTFRNSFYYYL